jgi:hypothetical protein
MHSSSGSNSVHSDINLIIHRNYKNGGHEIIGIEAKKKIVFCIFVHLPTGKSKITVKRVGL